jgi:hypothetical protein
MFGLLRMHNHSGQTNPSFQHARNDAHNSNHQIFKLLNFQIHYFYIVSKQKTYPYRAFSLNIVSAFPITGFQPAEVTKPDVVIHEGSVPENLENVINRGVLYQSNDREFLLRVDNVAAYYVCNGNEIIVCRLGKASHGEVSAFLTGTSFGALLHQRKLLPLHACTVLFNGMGLVFAGVSGSGKSTLAAALLKQGATLVADDVSVISFQNEKPGVYPAFPYIKIWEDSLRHLGMPLSGLEPVRGELRKYYFPVQQFSPKPAAIDHLFILGSHNKPVTEIINLQGVDKFRALKKHTYLFRGIPKTGLEQNHFFLAGRLASKVPMSRIARPDSGFDADNLVKTITEYLQQNNHE